MTAAMFACCAGGGNAVCDHRRRLSVFIPSRPVSFHHGQGRRLIISSNSALGRTIAGQLVVGANCWGNLWIVLAPQCFRASALWTMSIFVLLPIVVLAIRALAGFGHEPTLALPIGARVWSTLVGLPCAFLVRTNTGGWFRFVAQRRIGDRDCEFSPAMGPVLFPRRHVELPVRAAECAGSQALSCCDFQL